MKRVFGYIRVSTTKQAEKGVSLKEQRSAIKTYAAKQGFKIVGWYEEHVTAAKRGRPLFAAMLKALRQGKADGIVIHKIDRSARNLGDWADLGELIDAGFDIHFAHEPLDLRSRGGRLSADILAVVAADFIRNNRQEARKGFDGRLKEGIYPLGAPVGYLDHGRGGKVKTIDPRNGPLVRHAFERYASGTASLLPLLDEVTTKGLRNRKGKPLSLTGLVTMLRNPFYAGVIRLRKTGELFPAIHEPIIRMKTFRRVQEVLDGKKPRRTQQHDFRYRRLFSCVSCGRSLIGSLAKGHVYYRCQMTACPTTCVREDLLDDAVSKTLLRITLPEKHFARLRAEIEKVSSNAVETREASRVQLQTQLGSLTSRLGRLTDVYVDARIDKDAYDERRNALVMERNAVGDSLAHLDGDQARTLDFALRCLQLAKSPETLYESGSPSDRRRLVEILTSNRTVSGKNVEIAVAEPFRFLSSVQKSDLGALQTGQTRTFQNLEPSCVPALLKWAEQHPGEMIRIERLLAEENKDLAA
ncbi:MAG: resolvase [Acidobacteria bacterium]|nr:resolvase [Acidobacteriota bacterium]